MSVGAVVVLGDFPAESGLDKENVSGSPLALRSFSTTPAALFELLGEPIIHRIVESLRRRAVGPISLVVDNSLANHSAVRDISRSRVEIIRSAAEEIPSTIETAVARFAEHGIRSVLAMHAAVYAELNVADLMRFHRETRQRATFVSDSQGPLPIALIDTRHADSAWLLVQNRHTLPRYMGDFEHCGYTNRLNTIKDLRALGTAALSRQCQVRPNGDEVRPGIWVADSARIHPHARVNGSAYIGPYTRLRAGALISEGSVIERCCEVDRGTVVSDAAILPYTYLGVCLDIANAVVKQNKVVDLKRSCMLEISDTFIGASRVGERPSLPSLLGAGGLAGFGTVQAMRDRLRMLLSRKASATPARVSYEPPARAWNTLQTVPSTTDPRSS